MTSPHDVIDQMRAVGLDVPDGPLRMGTVKRVYFGPKQKQWYRLREITSRIDGRTVIVGAFGDFKTGLYERVDVDWQGMAAEERERMQAERTAAEAKDRAARAAEAARAAMSAAELWAHGSREGRSAYLERKGVQAEACRFLPDGSILVPLLRYDMPREQALRAVQRIWPDGRKRFTRGFSKPGVCLRLGLVEAGSPILVCEGYATGLTLRMAVERRLPVFVALDAGNLPHVALLLRRLHPGSALLLCADDDWRTVGNPGRAKAQEAAREAAAVSGNVRCAVTYPVFPQGRQAGDTDFNDLHARTGLQVVRRQLLMVLPSLSDYLASGEPAGDLEAPTRAA